MARTVLPKPAKAAFEAAIKEKRRVTSMLRDKNYPGKPADQDNITVITGRAHFTGPHSVEIATAEGPVAVTASKTSSIPVPRRAFRIFPVSTLRPASTPALD